MNFDFADVKPSVPNWFMIGIMAVTFILVFKWLATMDWMPQFGRDAAFAV